MPDISDGSWRHHEQRPNDDSAYPGGRKADDNANNGETGWPFGRRDRDEQTPDRIDRRADEEIEHVQQHIAPARLGLEIPPGISPLLHSGAYDCPGKHRAEQDKPDEHKQR